jgi:BirA family biotin operon repressor/biotin-[acetyl-CoA-carboxylase] ligase
MKWRIFHKKETLSTNTDAKVGQHGDVFTADYQSAGRGRLDHKWLSNRGENLMMSAVLDVGSLEITHAATLPLAVGLAVVKTISSLLGSKADVKLKWPNDVYVSDLKIAGILCERVGDNVVVGVGVNVHQKVFPPEISSRATSLELMGLKVDVKEVRDALLKFLLEIYNIWKEKGFIAIYPQISSVDWLKNRAVAVIQTDDDNKPMRGLCSGISTDGSLIVGDDNIWAGEAHVLLA